MASRFPADRIFILEESRLFGGSLDGAGSPERGYVIRGGRMLNFTYACTYDPFASIPSLHGPQQSVRDEIIAFNEKHKSHSKRRVFEGGRAIDVSSMGFSHQDRLALIDLMIHAEEHYGDRRIDEHLSPHFFATNFWFMWATMFAFQPWHSLVEFKRHLHRFIHEFPRVDTLEGVERTPYKQYDSMVRPLEKWLGQQERTPYKQYDSMVRPLEKWLGQQGVCFELDCRVVDVDFRLRDHDKAVERIHFERHGVPGEITLGKDDLAFFTLGSMTEGSDLGSMTAAPVLRSKRDGGAWTGLVGLIPFVTGIVGFCPIYRLFNLHTNRLPPPSGRAAA